MEGLTRIWQHAEEHTARLLRKRQEAPNATSLIYQPLQHREIRVVTLAPGKWNERLECTLETVSLDHNPSYETLSYVWGDSSVQKPILLQKRPFQVTQSLESALRHLRHQESERTMWIDALCINQNDDAEKTVQVKQMQFIYARTSHLVVWIGEASEDSELGMQTLRQIGEELKEGSHSDVDLANVSFMKRLPEHTAAFDPKPWVAANRLFRRDWFERVWVPSLCSVDKARY